MYNACRHETLITAVHMIPCKDAESEKLVLEALVLNVGELFQKSFPQSFVELLTLFLVFQVEDSCIMLGNLMFQDASKLILWCIILNLFRTFRCFF